MQVVHLCDASGAVGRGAVCMDVGTSIYNCRPLCRGCLVFIASQKLFWVWGMQGKQTADNLTPAGNIGIIKSSISTDLHSSQSVQQYQRHGNNSRAQWCGMTSRTPPLTGPPMEVTAERYSWHFPRHRCLPLLFSALRRSTGNKFAYMSACFSLSVNFGPHHCETEFPCWLASWLATDHWPQHRTNAIIHHADYIAVTIIEKKSILHIQ